MGESRSLGLSSFFFFFCNRCVLSFAGFVLVLCGIPFFFSLLFSIQFSFFF